MTGPTRRARFRVSQATRALRRPHIAETVTAILCLISVVFGVVLVSDRDVPGAHSFESALDRASPGFWAVLLIAPAIATTLSLAAHRRDVYWPLGGVTLWWTAWTLFAAVDAPDDNTVGTAAALGFGMCVLTGAMTAMYQGESHERHSDE